ncbi:MAG: hypothetical protein DCF16_12950 [Alphaproteobacteria bacterium]|nr:MAG: hypothetical protein DCF16_12950 [Alphaproteobacteria bacterium]
MRAKASKGVEQPPNTLAVRPALDISDATFVTYMNYAEVVQSMNEFTIVCGRLPTKLSATQRDEIVEAGGALRVEASVQLLLPATVIPGLIRALSAQKDAYETEYGPIYEASSST